MGGYPAVLVNANNPIVFDIPTRRIVLQAKHLTGRAPSARTKSDTAAYPLGGVSSSVILPPCFRANPHYPLYQPGILRLWPNTFLLGRGSPNRIPRRTRKVGYSLARSYIYVSGRIPTPQEFIRVSVVIVALITRWYYAPLAYRVRQIGYPAIL